MAQQILGISGTTARMALAYRGNGLTQHAVDRAVSGMADHGAISLRELRLGLQQATGIDLRLHKAEVRRMAELAVRRLEQGGLHDSPSGNTCKAPHAEPEWAGMWEPLPSVLSFHDRGRELFTVLHDLHSQHSRDGGEVPSLLIAASCDTSSVELRQPAISHDLVGSADSEMQDGCKQSSCSFGQATTLQFDVLRQGVVPGLLKIWYGEGATCDDAVLGTRRHARTKIQHAELFMFSNLDLEDLGPVEALEDVADVHQLEDDAGWLFSRNFDPGGVPLCLARWTDVGLDAPLNKTAEAWDSSDVRDRNIDAGSALHTTMCLQCRRIPIEILREKYTCEGNIPDGSEIADHFLMVAIGNNQAVKDAKYDKICDSVGALMSMPLWHQRGHGS